jgi:hypothetical protein
MLKPNMPDMLDDLARVLNILFFCKKTHSFTETVFACFFNGKYLAAGYARGEYHCHYDHRTALEDSMTLE